MTTYSREIAESEGQDFDEVVATLAQEREILSELLPAQSPEVNPISTDSEESESASEETPRRVSESENDNGEKTFKEDDDFGR